MKRKYELDNLKGILIFLVVFGHLLLSFTHATSNLASKIVAYIYFFHMPLFLIVSGFLTHKKLCKKDIVYLLVVFLSMNISYSLYDYYVNGVLELFILKYSSWYIILLLVYRIIINTNFFKEILKKDKFDILIISLFLSLIVQPLPTSLIIKRIFGNFYYFLFGYLIVNNDKIFKSKCNKKFVYLMIGFILSIIFLALNATTDINFYLGSSYSNKQDIVLKFVQIIVNSFFFLFLVNILPKCRLRFLTRVGQNSLYIYTLHRLPTLIISEYIIPDRKAKIILDIIIAFILCFALSSKLVIKITKGIYDFITNSLLKKNKIVLSIIFIIFLILLIISYNIEIFKKSNNNEKYTTIGFLGDLILLENQVNYSKKSLTYDFDYMFKYTKKYIKNTDYTIGVFEGPSDDSQNYSVGNYNDNKELRINHPGKFINSIKKAGIDLVTTANNHVYDKGYQGAINTIQNLNKRNLDFIGSGDNNQRKVVTINGIKVGIVAYTFYTNYQNDSSNNDLVKYLSDPNSEYFKTAKKNVKEDFNYLKRKNVDIIIVLPHYGSEFNFNFSSYQDEWNKVFIKYGADIIFGDHSHVIGPIISDNNKVIVSSPGNYVNSYNGQDSDISNYIKVYIDKKSKKISKTSVIPMLAQKKSAGYYPISFYDLSKKGKDNVRLKQAKYIFGKVLFNNPNIDIEEEYDIYNINTDLEKLEINNLDKETTVYKMIEKSSKICFIGDSITEGTMNDYHPWYETLMINFDDKSIENISKGSYTSDNILESFSKRIKNSNCDLNIINIGTNDIRYSMTNSEKYISNIKKIIKNMQDSSNIILLSPWETYSNDKIIGSNITMKKNLYGEYNKKLIELAENNDNIQYINTNRYIKSYIYKYGENEFLLDGVHPNDKMGIDLYSFSVIRGDRY